MLNPIPSSILFLKIISAKRISFALMLLFIFCSSLTFAKDLKVPKDPTDLKTLKELKAFSAVESLQEKLNDIHSMSAEFKQLVEAEGKELSKSSGVMILDRPGKFRWQTIKPSKQLVVADGKQIWMYDEDLEQVTIKKQAKTIDGVAFFLSKDNDLEKDFKISTKRIGNETTYYLNPKRSTSNFKRIQLIFETNDLKAIAMKDQLGQHTLIQFFNSKINIRIAENSFQFVPPKGTDIIKE